MKKEKNKKLIYIILPLIMLIPVVILFLHEGIAWICFVFGVTLYITILPFLIPVLIILDIICFVYAKEAMGIIGIVEAFIFIIYPVVTYCLFQFGYHHMLM